MSDTNDDEEIALAIQAAEAAARHEARARFSNSSELIHKLFVCVSGKKKNTSITYLIHCMLKGGPGGPEVACWTNDHCM